MKAYSQKPPLTRDELVTFLNEAPIARLSRLNPDGTIHMAAAYPFRGVLLYGEAVLEDEDVIAKGASIFERYMPAEDARQIASDLSSRFTCVVIRIKPKKITSYDYSKPVLTWIDWPTEPRRTGFACCMHSLER